MTPFHAHPDVLIALAAAGGAYLLWAREASGRQKASFGIGLSLILAVSVWPVHDVAESALYSVHMVQHTIYTLVGAPLLVAGIPASALHRLLARRPVYAVIRFVTRPMIALAFFNVVVILTHIPAIVALAARSEPFHFGAHLLLVASALAMWTPVLSPVLELPHLSYPKQMLYLFLQSVLPVVPASFLTFGQTVLYPSYHGAFGVSALTDMRIAGLFMKLVGSAILWGFIVAIFFRWYATETKEGVDALQFQDVDRHLNRTAI